MNIKLEPYQRLILTAVADKDGNRWARESDLADLYFAIAARLLNGYIAFDEDHGELARVLQQAGETWIREWEKRPIELDGDRA